MKQRFAISILVLLIALSICACTDSSSTVSSVGTSATAASTQEPLTQRVTKTEEEMLAEQEPALELAEKLLEEDAYSYEGLIQELVTDGYSDKAATYAADNCGADWYEQADIAAEQYLRYKYYSYEGLLERLENDRFTYEQALYAVEKCDVDWNRQAVRVAEEYASSSMTKDELISILKGEGFTNSQAVSAVEEVMNGSNGDDDRGDDMDY